MSISYSTGGVDDYAGCGGPDLDLCVAECSWFRFWYGGFQLFSRWENGDVWGSDFRDASGGDFETNGGSDIPMVYFYSGHGDCEDQPQPSDPDYIIVCGDFGKPDDTVIGTDCRWGNGPGNLRFAFIDASCPMDLISIGNSWFPTFDGLHMAVGHSGNTAQDTLDSVARGSQFAAYTVGGWAWFGTTFRTFPQLSIGDAWMLTGIIDVQSGCCAVALASGNDQADAINRCDNKKVNDNMSDPVPNWFAWKWICSSD